MKRADKADKDRMGQLISAGLRKQAAGAHLEAEVLAAFSENTLPSAERDQVMSHLANCGDCREVLFLAQPQPAESQAYFSPAPRRAALVVRWAALAAAVLIVGSGIFLSRHELTRNTETTAKQTPAPESLAKTAEEKTALDARRADTTAIPMEVTRAQANEARPALKHMTAKPQAKMQFDSSGEVHISSDAVASQPSNFPAQERNQFGLRDMVGTARPATPASPTPSGSVTDKASPNQMAGSVTESVEVTTSAAPVVTVDTGAPVKKDSVAQQQAALATAGYIGGAAFMKLQPPAKWSLTPAGAVQRSFDQGKTWQPVSVREGSGKFTCVDSSGTSVWVGGSAGALYHSVDSGLLWVKVTPADGGRQLTADITRIEFTDAQNGIVTASDDEVWQTADGGRTWVITKK